MDANLTAAILGLLGGLLGALVGGLYTLRAAARQIDTMMRQIRGDVHERLYNFNQTILGYIANHPHTIPYLDDNKPINECSDEKELDQLHIITEMVVSFLEIIAISIQELPEHDKLHWKLFIVEYYRNSPAIREFMHNYRDRISPKLHNILQEQGIEREELKPESNA
jgi:hypothetical protein